MEPHAQVMRELVDIQVFFTMLLPIALRRPDCGARVAGHALRVVLSAIRISSYRLTHHSPAAARIPCFTCMRRQASGNRKIPLTIRSWVFLLHSSLRPDRYPRFERSNFPVPTCVVDFTGR